MKQSTVKLLLAFDIIAFIIGMILIGTDASNGWFFIGVIISTVAVIDTVAYFSTKQ